MQLKILKTKITKAHISTYKIKSPRIGQTSQLVYWSQEFSNHKGSQIQIHQDPRRICT